MKCIRVLADVNQIIQCREDLSKIKNQTSMISKILGLAGNEVRLKILLLIYKEGKLCPCDLSDILTMSVPAISQHLRKLKDGGLIIDRKVGQTVLYSIVKENTVILKTILQNLSVVTHNEVSK